MYSYCAVCESAAALFSSDRIGGGEAQNCRPEKAVCTLPPSPQPRQSLFAQHDPFHSFPHIPFSVAPMQYSYTCLNP